MDPINNLLERGVDKIFPSKEELEKLLRSGRKLRVYQGFDPTGIQMHIGHLVGLRKLRQFQDLGHEVIFLIGDGTGQAGDPSGKTRAREKFLKLKELKENAKDYVMQARKVVNFEGLNPAKILYNSAWLNKLTLTEILNIAGYFSVQQLYERDMFQERMKKGETINLREFLYPILQAYDSVYMEVDLEVGGSDQTFNMLAGRSLLKSMKNKDKFVLTLDLITDSKGKKIGKTEGNVIAFTDKPEDLYGKIMSLSDEVILKSFEYLTDVNLEEIKKFENEIKNGANPMLYKKKLALEIVSLLNSKGTGEKAQEFFEHAHQKQDLQNVQDIAEVNGAGLSVKEIIVNNFMMSSSEIKRLISQKAIDLNERIIVDPNTHVKSNDIVKIGKNRIIKIK